MERMHTSECESVHKIRDARVDQRCRVCKTNARCVYTKNLDRLKPAIESSHPTSPKPCFVPASSHLPGMPAAKRLLEKSPFLFLPGECLFCGKKTIKKQRKKENLTKTFPGWSHKSSGWENIEKMAKKMQNKGYSSLL